MSDTPLFHWDYKQRLWVDRNGRAVNDGLQYHLGRFGPALPPLEDRVGPTIQTTVNLQQPVEEPVARYFATGATRDVDQDKLDFEGFLSPLVIERFARYMHKNRKQSDGRLRDSDNWQKGMPRRTFMASGWRHFMDWWYWHRTGRELRESVEDALCGLLFNVSGYLHEVLLKRSISDGLADASRVPADSASPLVVSPSEVEADHKEECVGQQ